MLAQVLGTDDRSVIQTLFDYLFHSINKYEYRAAMPSREEAKRVWAAVQKSGYVLLNCKLYLYARHVARTKGQRVKAADFEIAEADIPLLRRIQLSIKAKHKVLTLRQFLDAERVILTDPQIDLDGHMGRFINRKLKFLCRSYGLTLSGLKADFIETALYALRKQYPRFLSELHMVNICKTAIHNCGQSTISYWTRDKRNALRREDDGTFSAVHVDVDLVSSLNSVGVVDKKDDPHHQALESLQFEHHQLPGRAQRFVTLATGSYDAGFSLFLGESNEDLAHEWKYDRYLTQVRLYLGVSEVQQAKLLQHLKARV